MDSNTNVLYAAAGLPALIYLFLKVWHYLLYAISHKTEGRLAAATQGCGQQEHSTNTRKESHTEVYEQISRNITDQHGTGTQQSPGSLSVPRRWQDLCLTSRGDAAEYPEEPPFQENGKDCKAEGIEIPQTIMAKDPVAHMLTPQEYLQKVEAGLMPQMDNHQMMKELVEKNDQTKILMMEFRDIECLHPTTTPQTPKHK